MALVSLFKLNKSNSYLAGQQIKYMAKLDSRLKTTIGISFIILFFISCSEGVQKEKDVKEEEKVSTDENGEYQLTPDQQLTRNINLIAGMDTVLDYEHPEWDVEHIKSFSRNVNDKFARMQSNRLDKITDWNKSNLDRASIDKESFCFYPFSGGDFVHAKWLYPEAEEYLLVAQEPVGTIPDLTTSSGKEVMNYLDNVDEVLRDIYKRSYFITKNMQGDIRDLSTVDGMFPIIMWAVGRSEHDIVSIQYFDIAEDGSTSYIDPKDVTSKSRAVEVVMVHRPSGKNKKLSYISADISNTGFAEYPGVKKYLNNKVPASCNSFLKSASYLMHYTTFREIREIIQDKSKLIVQDDTGIPFKYFDQGTWNIDLFGKYDKPVSDFSSRLYQKDLDEAYANDSFYKGALNFSLGYHWGDNKQNYMFIYKK